MDRLTWGKGFEVAREDINELQDNIEQSEEFLAIFTGAEGIIETLTLPEDQRELATVENFPTANLSVDILAGNGIDNKGKVIRVRSQADLTMTTDDSGNSTAVAASGNERWASIFIEWDETDEDRRIDLDGLEYFQRQLDDHKFHIITSAEFLDTLSQIDKDNLRPAKPVAHYLIVADVLMTFSMTQIFDADIFKDRKEGITQGNAKNLGFDNDGLLYTPGTDDVDAALEEVMSFITGINTPTSVIELQHRYFQLATNNLRLFFDKTNDLVYSMKATKYDIKRVDQFWNGTKTGAVYEAEVSPTENYIVFRSNNVGGSTFTKELVLDKGDVFNPKVIWTGTEWGVFWVHEDTITSEISIRFQRIDDNDPPVPVGSMVFDINEASSKTLTDKNTYRWGVAWDSGLGKFLITWQDNADRIWIRELTRLTGVLGTSTRVDDGVSTSFTYFTPVVSRCNSFWVVSYTSSNNELNFVAFNDALSPTPATGEETIAISTGFVLGSLHSTCTTNDNVMVVLADSSLDAKSFRIDTTNLAAGYVSVGSWDAGGNVVQVFGLIWNTNFNNIAVFFSDDSHTKRLLYREMSESSVAGSNTEMDGSNNAIYSTTDGFLSKPQFEAGGTANYRFVGLDFALKFPFDIRPLKYFFAQDQATPTQSNPAFEQGDGGNFSLILGFNPKVAIKISLAEFDGDSITVTDDQIVKFDITPSLFTTGSITNNDNLITGGDIVDRASFVYNFATIKLLSRMDATVVDGIIVGNSTDVARTDLEYVASPAVIKGDGTFIEADPRTGQITIIDTGLATQAELDSAIAMIDMQYDLVFNRADFASDALAGAQLKTDIESGSFTTIFIRNGTYEFNGVATSLINVASNVTRIEAESLEGVELLFSGTNIGSNGTIYNIASCTFVNLRVHITNVTSLHGFESEPIEAQWINCKAERDLGIAIVTFAAGFRCTSDSALVKAHGCIVRGNFGINFENIRGGISDCRGVITLASIFFCKNITNFVFDSKAETGNNSVSIINVCENVSNVLVESIPGGYDFTSAPNQPAGFDIIAGCDTVNGFKWEDTLQNITSTIFSFLSNCDNISNIDIKLGMLTLSGSNPNMASSLRGFSNSTLSCFLRINNAAANVDIITDSVRLSGIELNINADDIPDPGASINCFSSCENLSSCFAFSFSTNIGGTLIGYNLCENMSACNAEFPNITNNNSVIIYEGCSEVAACRGQGDVASGPSGILYGYNNCDRVTTCLAENTGTSPGFRQSSGVSNRILNAGTGVSNTPITTFS